MCDKIPVWMVSESNPIPVGCLGCKGVSLEFRRLNVRVLACTYVFSVLAPVVQKLYSAIHGINRYPEDKYYENNCTIHWIVIFIQWIVLSAFRKTGARFLTSFIFIAVTFWNTFVDTWLLNRLKVPLRSYLRHDTNFFKCFVPNDKRFEVPP